MSIRFPAQRAAADNHTSPRLLRVDLADLADAVWGHSSPEDAYTALEHALTVQAVRHDRSWYLVATGAVTVRAFLADLLALADLGVEADQVALA